MFMLLQAHRPEMFGITTHNYPNEQPWDVLKESAQELGCSLTYSVDNKGNRTAYMTATTKEALEYAVSVADLEGTVVEVTSIYDQKVEIL